MFIINLTRASVVAAAVLLLPACGGGSTSPAVPTSINAGPGEGNILAPANSDRRQPSPAPSAGPSTTQSSIPSIIPTSGSVPVGWMWGVTSDNPSVKTAQQVVALSSFAKRPWVRTVFDLPSGGGPTAADYLPSIMAIAPIANIVALTDDSSTVAKTSLATIKARIAEYLAALSPYVSVWCVGNEVNGNWLGSGVIAKVEAEYDAVTAAGKPTAITLYYENPPTPGYDMIPWVDANIPVGNRMRTGLAYVGVSYYEDQNGGHQLTQTELNTIFSELAVRFPNAKVNFGEFGYGGKVPPETAAGNAKRAALLQRFYGYRVPSVPAYNGGGFYWEFRRTMVPKTLPDWGVLNRIMQQ